MAEDTLNYQKEIRRLKRLKKGSGMKITELMDELTNLLDKVPDQEIKIVIEVEDEDEVMIEEGDTFDIDDVSTYNNFCAIKILITDD